MVIADGSNGVTVRFGLPKTESQQQFSLAFVRMIVAAAGFSIKVHETDYDGVDLTIVSSVKYARWANPCFELQLKCTTRQELLKDDLLAWRMEAGQYLKLTEPVRFMPTYLAVVLVPIDISEWIHHHDEHLLTRGRMYFESAANLPVLPREQSSITVHLPRRNVFDVAHLQAIMKAIGDEGTGYGNDGCKRFP